MRACNGCRKRKIKCDAATTNTWPCSACTRLKLVCVPPTIGQDGDFAAEGQGMEPSDVGSISGVTEIPSHGYSVPVTYRDNQANMGALPSYDGMNMYSQLAHAPAVQPGLYNDMRSPPLVMPQPSYQQTPIFQATEPSPLGAADRGVYVENESSAAENLSDVLGELKIDETGIGTHVLLPISCKGRFC